MNCIKVLQQQQYFVVASGSPVVTNMKSSKKTTRIKKLMLFDVSAGDTFIYILQHPKMFSPECVAVKKKQGKHH